jgi:hypothetical protein
MQILPIHRVRASINTAKLIEKRLEECIDLIATPQPGSTLEVDGITVEPASESDIALRVIALRKRYALSLSYCYSEHTGPLGVISLQEMLPRSELAGAIFTATVDSNGLVTCSDGTGFSMFDIGREIPADMARTNLLFKMLGSIIAALPAPPDVSVQAA